MYLKDIVIGLNILVKYAPDRYLSAEHDEIHSPVLEGEVTEEEKKILEDLDWFIDEGEWMFFT